MGSAEVVCRGVDATHHAPGRGGGPPGGRLRLSTLTSVPCGTGRGESRAAKESAVSRVLVRTKGIAVRRIRTAASWCRNGDALSDAGEQTRFDRLRSMEADSFLTRRGRPPSAHRPPLPRPHPVYAARRPSRGTRPPVAQPSGERFGASSPGVSKPLRHTTPRSPRKLEKTLRQEAVIGSQLLCRGIPIG